MIGLAARPSVTTWRSSVSVAADAAALAAHREGRADDRRQGDAAVGEALLDLGQGLDRDRPGDADPGLVHRRAELLAVLGAVDRGGVGADQLDPEPLQGAVLVQAIARFSAVWPPSVGSSASGRSFSMILVTGPGSSGSM